MLLEDIPTQNELEPLITISRRDFYVREMSFSDLSTLEKLWAECSNQTRTFFHPGFFQKEIRNGYFNPIWRLSLTISTNRIIGKLLSASMIPEVAWITCVLCVRNEIAGFAYIRRKGRRRGVLGIFLSDRFQERGFGSYLLSMTIRKAYAQGLSLFDLTVNESNYRARRFFETFGFEYVGCPLEVRRGAKRIVSLRMSLKINGS